jgi:hypothetical protein
MAGVMWVCGVIVYQCIRLLKRARIKMARAFMANVMTIKMTPAAAALT